MEKIEKITPTKESFLFIFRDATGFVNIEERPITAFLRPDLVKKIEEWEENVGVKGKTSLLERGVQPLAWLDDKGVTFGDLADYYAGVPGKVSEIKRTDEKSREEFAKEVRKAFAASLKEPLKFSECMVVKTAEYDYGNWSDTIYFLEMELKVQLPADLEDAVKDDTTIDNLVDMFVAAKFD